MALSLSSAVGLAGRSRRALSRSGAVGAVVVGGTVHYAGGWRWSAALLFFFATSSGLSRLSKRKNAADRLVTIEVRGSERDIVQVLANGGVAVAIALAYIRQPRLVLANAFAGAFAAANADTWATEIGKTSAAPPHMILSGKVVPRGTSGAVSVRGLMASAAGSALIALVSSMTIPGANKKRRIAATALAGCIGSLADSIAGATIQAAYSCPLCSRPTEHRIHTCGARTILTSGYSWCNNDVVNVICTSAGALCGALVSRFLGATTTDSDGTIVR